ncbi:hypothetical protein BJX66DRAFT_90274 [Aspergillus keveii]|uniref:Uncharacterized protein n=1 Tax=Aspergillus keveii TaxID=714993 RepID=A0ABR4FLW2_9EURO
MTFSRATQTRRTMKDTWAMQQSQPHTTTAKLLFLVVPKVFRNALMWHTMQNGELEILPFLAHLRDQVTNAPSDQKLHDQLLGLCRNIVASYGTQTKLRVADFRSTYSYNHWDKTKIAEPKLRDTVAQIAFSHREWDLFKSAVTEATTVFGAKFGRPYTTTVF